MVTSFFMRLSILTYNIHRAIGSDGQYRPDRIIEVIKRADPDIIALQEVDRSVPRSAHHDMARVLAEELGMKWRFRENVQLRQGGYGNATLSKYPIVRAVNLDLTWSIKKPRGCLLSEIKVRGRSVIVLNFHLGLAAVEQVRQARRLLNSWHRYTIRKHPAVLLGDCNDRRNRLDRIFSEAGFHNAGTSRAMRSFPSFAPILRLDRVYMSPHFEVNRAQVLKTDTTRVASDHLPVLILADF
ncbi:MAG: endonuclease/exonuclease/phosphatase family protein [Spirochaetia bacterium]|nr:endonuclease/exonuclease/phosphatase family protein [Spirochaetia bacterium]